MITAPKGVAPWHGQRSLPALAGALLSLLLVGWLDYATGVELLVFPLYFVPLTVVSLRLSPRMACTFALLSTVTWVGSNRLAGMGAGQPGLMAANAATMLVAFAFFTLLIVKQRRSLDRERSLSRTDSLTGLPNSRGFYEAASGELVRSARYRRPVTLAYLDVDDFKAVNDRFGHARGDTLLVAIAQVLRQASRASDLVGRIGGDEFAILYPETDRAAAEAVLQNMQSRLRDLLKTEREGPLTLSIGVVTFATPPAEVETLVRQADALMYAVKSSGKDDMRSAEGSSEPREKPPAPGREGEA